MCVLSSIIPRLQLCCRITKLLSPSVHLSPFPPSLSSPFPCLFIRDAQRHFPVKPPSSTESWVQCVWPTGRPDDQNLSMQQTPVQFCIETNTAVHHGLASFPGLLFRPGNEGVHGMVYKDRSLKLLVGIHIHYTCIRLKTYQP